MLYFVDKLKKIVYIMAPKCGTQTIAKYLDVSIHQDEEYNLTTELIDDEYRKYIIIREDIIERFLSGVNEDLYSNSCYNNMDISLKVYILSIYINLLNKTPLLNKITINNTEYPIWFGESDTCTIPITDTLGNLCSHILSQEYAIKNIVYNIKGNNVRVLDINNLNKILGHGNTLHVNKKIEKNKNLRLSLTKMNEIKKNEYKLTSENIDELDKNIILEMFKEDINFIDYLKNKYKVICNSDTESEDEHEDHDKDESEDEHEHHDKDESEDRDKDESEDDDKDESEDEHESEDEDESEDEHESEDEDESEDEHESEDHDKDESEDEHEHHDKDEHEDHDKDESEDEILK